jgi:hypothetical protein
VSYAYYARLEQGYGETMSAEVMDAVAHALRLTEEERDHLIRLAQPDRNRTPRVAPPPQRLRPTVQHLSSLIRELSHKSEEFRRLWARHEVSCGTVGEVVLCVLAVPVGRLLRTRFTPRRTRHASTLEERGGRRSSRSVSASPGLR